VLTVLGVAILCTQWLGLGERAVFLAIAGGNVLSATGLVALFVVTERRVRAGGRAPSPVGALAAAGSR